MRGLYEILSSDIYGEEFTRREMIIFGIAYPLGLIAACVLAEALVRLVVFNTL